MKQYRTLKLHDIRPKGYEFKQKNKNPWTKGAFIGCKIDKNDLKNNDYRVPIIQKRRKTISAKRRVQQRKVHILSEEEFVESLKKRLPPMKWDRVYAPYIAQIAYRHFVLMLKRKK